MRSVRVAEAATRRGLEPRSLAEITEPLRPVTSAGPPGFEPGPARLELAVLPVTPQAYQGADWAAPTIKDAGLCPRVRLKRSGRPGSNGPLRGGSPVLFRLSYVRTRGADSAAPTIKDAWALPARPPYRIRPAGLEPASSAVSGQRSPLSYRRASVRKKEPPAGVEPAPRPYKGRVLAVDTTEAYGAEGIRTLVFPLLSGFYA